MYEKIMSGRELKTPVIESCALSWPALKPAEIDEDVPLPSRASKTITSTTYRLSRTENALANLNEESRLGIVTGIVTH